MKYNLFLYLFLFGLTCTYSQEDNINFKKAKLFLKDYRIIKVKDFSFNSNSANFFNMTTKENQSLSMDKISSIKIPKGNYMVPGVIYGAVTMALTALLVDIDEDPLGRPNQVTTGEYLGITAGGAVIGGIIGYFFPKWRTTYNNGEFLSKQMPFKLSIDTIYDDLVLKITIPL